MAREGLALDRMYSLNDFNQSVGEATRGRKHGY